jgi:hypothetical protein
MAIVLAVGSGGFQSKITLEFSLLVDLRGFDDLVEALDVLYDPLAHSWLSLVIQYCRECQPFFGVVFVPELWHADCHGSGWERFQCAKRGSL